MTADTVLIRVSHPVAYRMTGEPVKNISPGTHSVSRQCAADLWLGGLCVLIADDCMSLSGYLEVCGVSRVRSVRSVSINPDHSAIEQFARAASGKAPPLEQVDVGEPPASDTEYARRAGDGLAFPSDPPTAAEANIAAVICSRNALRHALAQIEALGRQYLKARK
jgi:hypothetical protein